MKERDRTGQKNAKEQENFDEKWEYLGVSFGVNYCNDLFHDMTGDNKDTKD